MPGLSIQCPGCTAALRVPASLNPGATIRCYKCNAVFKYREKTAPQLPDWVASQLEGQEPRPAKEDKDRRTAVRRSESPPSRHREGAPAGLAPDRPRLAARRRRKDRAARPNTILLLSLAGGAAAVGLLFLGGIVLWLASRPSGASVAAATPVTSPPPAPALTAPPLKTQPSNPQPPAVVNPDPLANPGSPPAVNPNPPAPAPGGSGVLADAVIDKIKKATVYIRVASAEGAASGTGFFEATSGMVLTNAHVVGMLHADDPTPQKIEVVLRSGERDEKTLPGKIAAVDRLSDLAVLNVDMRAAGLAAPPASLTVSSAAGLRETQQVYVAGFPFGENLGKDITIRTSSVASLRKDKDGVLAKVQVNGGMDPGNSGGPVVDAGGNVVGVAVAGIRGTQINFAIPGDTVQAVFRGRCSEIRAGEAFRNKDGQIAVPVDLTTIDPTHGLRNVALDWWVGDPKDAVGPSDAQPGSPAPPTRQTTPMAYQPGAMTGHADIVLPSMPPTGKVLWVQPNFVDASGRSRWVSGVPVAVAQPVDVKPALLALRPAVGKTRVDLTSTATVQVRTSDGEKHSLLKNIATRMIEETRGVKPDGSTVYYAFDHFEVGRSIDGKGPPPSARSQAIVQDVGKLGLNLVMDPQGNITQKQSDTGRVPPSSRDALDGMGDQLLQSLDVAAIPVPGGMTQPGQTWQASRNVPIDTIDSYQTAVTAMTYTYRGVRSVDGQDYGIVALHGVVRPVKGRASNLNGQVNGTAAIDLSAGRVHEVHAVVDTTMDVRFRDESLTCNGKLEVKLTRTAP